jgi:Tfp pilus assembly protein PilN
MLFLLFYPFRLIASGFYWARFRVGGAVRSRMASIELDNACLWERNFGLEARIAKLEAAETERKQAVLIEQVLQKFPEKG